MSDALATNPDLSARGPTESQSSPPRPQNVALIGNPNVGKTALFNALTGFNRHVANYPGVTVDIARGPLRGTQRPITIVDLPGAYSLAAASPDEMILCDALFGRRRDVPRPDAVIVVVDASNPQRNFYLLSQVLDANLPLVVALNMIDVAKRRGIETDVRRLSKRLGVPVIGLVATDPTTVAPLVEALETVLDQPPTTTRAALPEMLLDEARQLASASAQQLSTTEALRAIADQDGHAPRVFAARGGDPRRLSEARDRLVRAGIEPGPAEVHARYHWVDRTLAGVIDRKLVPGDTRTHKLDALLTHRLFGGIILLSVLYGLFYSIYSLAEPIMGAIEAGFGWAAAQVAAALPEGVLQSAIVDGAIAGVGGVIVFLPQILILFMFVAVLEDCGYLARAAFMADRLMRPMGLSGRSLIPLMSSFACAVPAIMGTRAIADRRERFTTIMIAPFMSCSARLPVYILLIGALIPDQPWLGGWLRLDALVLLGMYLVGIIAAGPVALLLARGVFAGPPSAFLLELPPYRVPRLKAVWQRMYDAGRGFLVRAGSVILIVNIVVWALCYFPRSEATRGTVEAQRAANGWDEGRFENELAGAYLRTSYLGQMGHWIEPAVRPLGWDWRIGVGVIASFPAREVIVATLGTVFNLGRDVDEGSNELRAAVAHATWPDGRPLFTIPVALSLMVFFALCAQCVSTLAVIAKETGSLIWPTISFVGMTTIAYFAAWATAAVASAIAAA